MEQEALLQVGNAAALLSDGRDVWPLKGGGLNANFRIRPGTYSLRLEDEHLGALPKSTVQHDVPVEKLREWLDVNKCDATFRGRAQQRTCTLAFDAKPAKLYTLWLFIGDCPLRLDESGLYKTAPTHMLLAFGRNEEVAHLSYAFVVVEDDALHLDLSSRPPVIGWCGNRQPPAVVGRQANHWERVAESPDGATRPAVTPVRASEALPLSSP